MSQGDHNVNAIPEAERIQQLAKLNAVADEVITANNSEEIIDTDQDSAGNGQVNGSGLAEESISKDTQPDSVDIKNSRSGSDNVDASHSESYKTLKHNVPSEIVEGIADDISEGVVKDFSQNIATYITEVCKFDEQYEKNQTNSTSDNNEQESVSSVSETTDNTPEPESFSSPQSETDKQSRETVDTQNGSEGKARAFEPEDVKENDVKDECFNKKNEEETKGENADVKDEEEDGYMDILGNGLLKRKVSQCMFTIV